MSTQLKAKGKDEMKKTFGFGKSNIILRQMQKKADTVEDTQTATYKGITIKTIFMLAMCFVGVGVYFLLHNLFLSIANPSDVITVVTYHGLVDIHTTVPEVITMGVIGLAVIVLPFIAWFIKSASAVAGTIYAVFEGYFVGVITGGLDSSLQWVSLAALGITVAVVLTMLYLFSKKNVRLGKRGRTIITAFFFVTIIGSILAVLMNFVPFLKPLTAGMAMLYSNPLISIGGSIVFVVIAILFLLVDFETISDCVENKLPKKLEWYAAFGLVYTIIYIYFKILEIILRILAKSKNN